MKKDDVSLVFFDKKRNRSCMSLGDIRKAIVLWEKDHRKAVKQKKTRYANWCRLEITNLTTIYNWFEKYRESNDFYVQVPVLDLDKIIDKTFDYNANVVIPEECDFRVNVNAYNKEDPYGGGIILDVEADEVLSKTLEQNVVRIFALPAFMRFVEKYPKNIKPISKKFLDVAAKEPERESAKFWEDNVIY